jgi:deoxycytidylate deaminase
VIGEAELRRSLMEAKAVALHSSRCLRKKVGAVLYDNEGKFLAYGANINPPGKPCDEGFCPRGRLSYAERAANTPYDNCTAWHAEMVALLIARERVGGVIKKFAGQIINNEALEEGVIVVTHEPCHECMPRLKALRINVYWPEGRVLVP